MFKDRMEGKGVTKGTIIVGGNAGNAYSFVASRVRKLACLMEQCRKREVKILVVEES